MRSDAKMELIEVSAQLIPKGKPNFLEVIRFPKIEALIEQVGRRKMRKIIFLLVKDFCNSVNVVRNMNEDQMIEAAAMLLEECGNFRLEDYVMMFSMAKKGELVKIMDRVDIQMISAMLDEYWEKRNAAAESVNENAIKHFDSLGKTARSIEDRHPMEAKMMQTIDHLAAGFSSFRDFTASIDEETAKSQIVTNPNYKNPYPVPDK